MVYSSSSITGYISSHIKMLYRNNTSWSRIVGSVNFVPAYIYRQDQLITVVERQHDRKRFFFRRYIKQRNKCSIYLKLLCTSIIRSNYLLEIFFSFHGTQKRNTFPNLRSMAAAADGWKDIAELRRPPQTQWQHYSFVLFLMCFSLLII